jgi:hypothetical protein
MLMRVWAIIAKGIIAMAQAINMAANLLLNRRLFIKSLLTLSVTFSAILSDFQHVGCGNLMSLSVLAVRRYLDPAFRCGVAA